MSEFTVHVSLNPDDREKIYVPYAVIDYKAIETGIIPNRKSSDVKFESTYTGSSTPFLIAAFVFLIIAFVISLLLAGWRIFLWILQNPRKVYRETPYKRPNWTLHLVGAVIFNLADCIQLIMFWYLFVVSGFLYVFFKWQNRATLMIPYFTDQIYIWFIVWLSVITVAKFIVLYTKIYRQCTIDVYLLDREKNQNSIH